MKRTNNRDYRRRKTKKINIRKTKQSKTGRRNKKRNTKRKTKTSMRGGMRGLRCFGCGSQPVVSDISTAGESKVDVELGEEEAVLIQLHVEAQLEHVRNSMVLGKRSGLDYHTWLERSMPGDYHNEFVSKSRKNEPWHEMWNESSADKPLVHLYTTPKDNIIDVGMIEAELRSRMSNTSESGADKLDTVKDFRKIIKDKK